MVGMLICSFKQFCKGMIKYIDFEQVKVIVELGVGDGVIIKYIFCNMCFDVKLIVFEVNFKFCVLMWVIQDDCFIVVEDFVEYIGKYLVEVGVEEIDFVVFVIFFVVLFKEFGCIIVGKVY